MINKGYEPTLVTKNRMMVLDLMTSSKLLGSNISNWQVSSEVDTRIINIYNSELKLVLDVIQYRNKNGWTKRVSSNRWKTTLKTVSSQLVIVAKSRLSLNLSPPIIRREKRQ